MREILLFFPFLLLSAAAAAGGGDGEWSKPAVVTHDDQPAITYRARVAGDRHLIVDVKIEEGWHTFTMDNDRRAAEKLAGKKALSGDKPTTIAVSGGLEVSGPWLQSEPKDFSNAEIRLYSWGFEKHATFAAPVKAAAAGGELRIRGQACTEAVCKNIDVTLAVPAPKQNGSGAGPAQAAVELKQLIAVKPL